MRFLLDTNAIIALSKKDARFLSRIRDYAPSDFGLPAIVQYELYFGAYKSSRVAANIATIETLPFPIVGFDRDDARAAGAIRAALQVAGTPIGPYDVLIAGQALARDLTLITRNAREFSRVERLRFEDWK